MNQAYVGGLDGYWFIDRDREWVVTAGLAGSHLAGTSTAVAGLQRAAQRYYQRPDAPHVRFDPARTALSGWTGSVAVNRNRGNVTANAMVWGMSPGFDSNDLGFATQTDRAGGHGMVLFRKLTPDRFTRSRQWWIAKWWTWNYGRESQGDGIQTATNLQFLNYWRWNLSFNWSRDTWDDKLTRGGPTTVRPGLTTATTSLTTDTRRRTWLTVIGSTQQRHYGAWQRTVEADLTWKPSDAVQVTAGPGVLRSQVVAQYLSTIPDALATATFGSRYVFGELARTELSMPTRVNVAFTPHLTMQLYMQPLVSVGDYGAITELARPRSYEFLRYGEDVGAIERLPGSGDLVIDPDGSGPAAPFRVARPDFSVKSLRINTVLRWEFHPGSTGYFVWTRLGQDLSRPGEFNVGDTLGALWRAAPDDVLLVKVSYWFTR